MKIGTPPPGSVRPDRCGDASGRSACHMQPSQSHRRENLGGEARGADGAASVGSLAAAGGQFRLRRALGVWD